MIKDSNGRVMADLRVGDRVRVQARRIHEFHEPLVRFGAVVALNEGSTHPFDVHFDGEDTPVSCNAILVFTKVQPCEPNHNDHENGPG